MKKVFDLISRYIWLQLIAVALVFFGVSRMAGASLQAVEGGGRMAVSPTDQAEESNAVSSEIDTSALESAMPSVEDPETSWPSGGFGEWNTSEGAYSPNSTIPQSRPSTQQSSRPASQPAQSSPQASQPPQAVTPDSGPEVSFVESGSVPTDPTGGFSQPSESSPQTPGPGSESSTPLSPGMDVPGEFTSSGALTPDSGVSSSSPSSSPSSPSSGTSPAGPGGESSTPLSPGMDIPGEFTSSGALTPDGNS